MAKTFDSKSIISVTFIAVMLIAGFMLFAAVPTAKGQIQLIGAPTYPSWNTTVPTGVTPSISVPTEAFMSITPYPVGINQTVLVNIWMEPPTNTNRYYSGFYVNITKPDGTTETVGPLNSYLGDSTAYFTYTVNQLGDWKFQFSFAGNYFPPGWYFQGVVYPSYAAIPPALIAAINPAFLAFSGPIQLQDAYYKPSTSPVTTITVQQQQVVSWPPAPLPTDYWTRPIPIDYREWWVIGGQYPFAGQGGGTGYPANTNTFASNYRYTPYVQGPTSAHIVWLQQGGLVGIAGGQYGYRSIGSGETAYSGTPNIIFQGRAYQTITRPEPVTINGSDVIEATSVWECYDIRTGQVLWYQTGITQPPTVVTYNQATPSEPGAEQTGLGTGTWSLMYIGSRLIKYDPWSGAVTLNISLPVTSGTYYDEPFVLSVQNIGTPTIPNYRLINWTTTGSDSNFTNRVMGNVSYPFSSLGTAADYESMIAVSVGTITPPGMGSPGGQIVMAASLTTGKLLWNITTPDIFFSTSTAVADHGKFAVRVLGGWWDCWNLQTGQLVWQTAKAGTPGGEAYPWGDFGAYTVASYGGLIFDFSYASIYAINWNNGALVWNFTNPIVAFEQPWYPSSSWFSNSPQIADGKLYYANGEHSPTEPLARGWGLFCLNATSGQRIWNMTGGGTGGTAGAIADGYLSFANFDDGYLYSFGKGPSATTVSVPQTQITAGENVVISGTVFDESPGMIPVSTAPEASTSVFKNDRGLANVACVSDDSMGTYMAWLYQQQPIDGLYHNITVTGVPISIDAIDPSGGSIHIATVTSTVTGTYATTWAAPSTAGDYTITATFAGTDSYGSSFAEAPATIATATTSPTPSSGATATPVANLATSGELLTYIVVGVIAIIIAIAIVGIVLYRKH